MADSFIKNTQVKTTATPKKGIDLEKGGSSVKQSSNDLWDMLNMEFSTGKTTANTDVYNELSKLQKEAQQYQSILSSPFAPSLDITG